MATSHSNPRNQWSGRDNLEFVSITWDTAQTNLTVIPAKSGREILILGYIACVSASGGSATWKLVSNGIELQPATPLYSPGVPFEVSSEDGLMVGSTSSLVKLTTTGAGMLYLQYCYV